MIAGPTVSRRAALGAIAVPAGLAAAAGLAGCAFAAAPGPVVEAEEFGAFGDGSGDSAPAIRAALGSLARQGGGTLRLRTGKTYLLESIDPATGLLPPALRASIGIPAGSSGLTVDLNGATLRQASTAATIGPGYRRFNDAPLKASAIPVAGQPRRGDTSVRLAPGSSPLPVGAVVMLVSANTTPRKDIWLPVAEMLVIADASDGELRFDRPLAKDHRRIGGFPLGLVDLSGDSARDFALIGPGTIVNPRRHCGNLMQLLGLRMDRVHCEARAGLLLRGREMTVSDCTATVTEDWTAPVIRPMCLALDTGSSNARITRFRASGGAGMTYLHLHEGLADVAVSGLRIDNGARRAPGGAPVGAVSIQGGSRNVSVTSARIHGNPLGAGILARHYRPLGLSNRDLELSDIVLSGRFAGPALIVQDDAPVRLENVNLVRARARGARLVRIDGPHDLHNLAMP